MKNFVPKILILIFCLFAETGFSQTKVYLFPGQGSDYRIFQNLVFPENFDTVCMSYPIPDKNETLQQFAYRFVSQIDTDNRFILVGVSMGGMICSELSDTLHPEKTIIISSAKCAKELPKRYSFQQKIPLNKAVPKRLIKAGALFLQPIVEPDRNKFKEIFKSMLGSKSPIYLKRSANMIVNWQKQTFNQSIIHIHGSNDHTIPLKNVDANYVIPNGSHMMTLTMSDSINKIFEAIFY